MAFDILNNALPWVLLLIRENAHMHFKKCGTIFPMQKFGHDFPLPQPPPPSLWRRYSCNSSNNGSSRDKCTGGFSIGSCSTSIRPTDSKGHRCQHRTKSFFFQRVFLMMGNSYAHLLKTQVGLVTLNADSLLAHCPPSPRALPKTLVVRASF